MNKYGVYIIIIFCLSACNYRRVITDEVVYSTLNNIIENDSIVLPVVCSRFEKPGIPDSIIKRYFDDDGAFVRNQLALIEAYSVKSGKLLYYAKKQRAFKKCIVDASCANNYDCDISYPVYSPDLKTVVVSFSMFDQGYCAVYRLKSHKWVLIDKYTSWIF